MVIVPFPGDDERHASKTAHDRFQQLCADGASAAQVAAGLLPRHPACPRRWLEVDMHLKLAGDHMSRASSLHRQHLGDPPRQS